MKYKPLKAKQNQIKMSSVDNSFVCAQTGENELWDVLISQYAVF